MKKEGLDEGWIESYQLTNKEQVSPSHAIHVVKTEDIIGLIDAWIIQHPKLLMKNDISELTEELKRVFMRLKR